MRERLAAWGFAYHNHVSRFCLVFSLYFFCLLTQVLAILKLCQMKKLLHVWRLCIQAIRRCVQICITPRPWEVFFDDKVCLNVLYSFKHVSLTVHIYFSMYNVTWMFLGKISSMRNSPENLGFGLSVCRICARWCH